MEGLIDVNPADVKSFWIIGAGRFGGIAAKRLAARYTRSSLLVVDISDVALRRLSGLPVKTVQGDGVDFLAGCLTGKDIPSYIVPAVPVHLAFEWLKRKLWQDFEVIRVFVPERAASILPNPTRAEADKLYSSYANFLCPDDCPEPPAVCTVTGEKRQGFLYRDLQDLRVEGFVSIGLRSVQLAPGVGGYKPVDLWSALEKVRQAGTEKGFLLSTACLCHGVVNAFRLANRA
ncbi:MAG: hypothetical protein ACOY40_06915 [Bacillota bacterium]